ncbi:MAG: tetratricopeptide repeat protein [Candidatus Aminicenantales bacterium]
MKSPSARPRIKLIFFAFVILFSLSIRSSPCAQEEYSVPAEIPKSHYRIDARIDLVTHGAIEGKETIVFKNSAKEKIEMIALDWSISPDSALSVSVGGEDIAPLNPENLAALPSPLFFVLPKPLKPGKKVEIAAAFKKCVEFSAKDREFKETRWYPRLWWDGLPLHDAYSVKLDIPAGFALAASGLLNPKTGRFENDGARTFGIYLGKDMKTDSRKVEGVLVTTVATEKGAMCAAVCLETAADVIRFCRERLGFYPFDFLSIIPGGVGRWGGYPFATGIVVIHGQETFKEEDPILWWQHITSHEIGHEYWGEWVLDPDDPAWLWIGMGIFIDTEYIMVRSFDPDRRRNWIGNYLNGLRMYYDMTVDIPPARLEKIQYDHNNTVVHSKGPSIIFALDAVLGRDTFMKIYRKCLREFGGKRLGWRDFQRFCERETGQSLAWFFEQWVRTNGYLCYKIEGQDCKQEGEGFVSTVKVRRLGTMRMPVPVKAVFEDGSEQIQRINRLFDVESLVFRSRSKFKEAILDPEKKFAMVDEPIPPISAAAAEMLALGWEGKDSLTVYKAIKDAGIEIKETWYRLGMQLFELGQYPESFDCFQKVSGLQRDGLEKCAALGWMGLLQDLQGKRAEALAHYREALKYDTGRPMGHGSLRIRIDRPWLEERLKTPFTIESTVEIPAQPTSDQLIQIVDDLNWTREGKTPLVVFEKAKTLTISDPNFWLKLGLLLFDGSHYPQSFSAFDKLSALAPSELIKFTALVWMGHLMDLQGKREKAIGYYREALEHDPGSAMTHSQYGMRLDRRWVEERLRSPFVWKK